MKKCYKIFITAAIIALPLLAEAASMSVQVKESTVRATPSFLGKIVGHVKYADTLDVTKKQGDWANVLLNNKSGWIHSSALSEKKIVLKSSSYQASTAASSDEIMLAGKGFSAEVEADYRSKNTSLDYGRLDEMEKYKISEKAEAAFIREGKLTVNGGVQ